MGFTSWLRNCLGSRATRERQRPAAPRFRPTFDVLEGREVPATLVVTTEIDEVKADEFLSLREAIDDANSGDIISISNFPYSMLEMPVEISKDDANLTYEAKTDKIPPQWSKVWVLLEPVPAKK